MERGLVCFTLLVVLLLGIPTLMYPLYTDQGMFSYIGRDLAEGGVPYRDSWDLKPPGIFLVYALGWWMTSEFALAPRLLDLAAVVWTAYLLIALCRRIGQPKAGPYSAFLFGLIYFSEFNFANTAQAESFAAPFTVLAIVWAFDAREKGWRYALGSGLCIGMLAMLKTSLAIYGLIPLALFLFLPPLWPRFVGYLGGTLAIPLLFVGFFALHGAVSELGTVLEAQAAYAQVTEEMGWPRFQKIVFGLFEFYPYLYAASILTFLGMVRWRDLRNQAFLWVWVAGFWVQVIAQNKYLEYHFVPWVLPAALGSGMLLSALVERLMSSRIELVRALGRFAVPGLLGLLVVRNLWYFVVPLKVVTGSLPREKYDRLFVYNFYGYLDSKKAAELVKSVTQPGDRIQAYAFDPTIYLLSGRRAVSRHISNAPIRLEGWFPEPMRRRFFAELERDVKADPPKALVTDFQWDWGFASASPDNPRGVRFCGLEYRFVGISRHLVVFRLIE